MPAKATSFAWKKQADVVVGRIPVTNGKMALGKMEVRVQGDLKMRRPYVVIEASAQKFPRANTAGARALADWLCGERGQASLLGSGRQSPGGIRSTTRSIYPTSRSNSALGACGGATRPALPL